MLLAGGGVEVEGGSEERKLPTARQDGPYYAFKPLLKGVGRLLQPVGILIVPMSGAKNIF